MNPNLLKSFILPVLALIMHTNSYAEDATIPLPQHDSLPFQRYASTGKQLLVWFANERGFAPAELQAAEKLAQGGVEVWQIDLLNGLFLPQLAHSLDGINPDTMKAILDAATKTGKATVFYATARASVPLLKTLAGKPACVLLMYPNFYTRAEAMDGADYISFKDLGKLDITLLQPKRSAAAPWLENQIEALRADGAHVNAQLLDKLREGFWRREDASPYEINQGQNLAGLLAGWIKDTSCSSK